VEESQVSNLIAVAYDDVDTARTVLNQLGELTTEHAISLDDAVIVEHRPDGKVKLHQSSRPGAAGAAGGAVWGGLIGLLFLAPMVGMAIGAASGALGGKMADVGVDDKFMKDLGAKLQPGAAALIVLGSTDAGDKVIDRVKSYGGDVIQTSLSTDAERHLREALAGEPAPA
jgi:uncharacterized membrane protein